MKCIFCFFFLWIRKRVDNKTCFFKNYICRTIFKLFVITSHFFIRTAVTSKYEFFATICDSIHSLTILRKSSIIAFVGALSPTLITDIFASQSWVLINLKPIFLSYRNWSISSNSKDGWLLRHGNISVSNILRKDNLKLIGDSFHPARCKNRSIKYFFQTTK